MVLCREWRAEVERLREEVARHPSAPARDAERPRRTPASRIRWDEAVRLEETLLAQEQTIQELRAELDARDRTIESLLAPQQAAQLGGDVPAGPRASAAPATTRPRLPLCPDGWDPAQDTEGNIPRTPRWDD